MGTTSCSCGYEACSSFSFCPQCGSELDNVLVDDEEETCECGHTVGKGSRFCPQCGTDKERPIDDSIGRSEMERSTNRSSSDALQPRLSEPARRLGAYLLEMVILGLTTWLWVLEGNRPRSPEVLDQYAPLYVAFSIIVLGLWIWEFVCWSRSTTIGKSLMGMTAVDARSGEYFGFWMMLVRETIGKFVSGSVLGLGFIWVLFDAHRQGWHDKVIGSIVVDSATVRSAKVSSQESDC